MALIDRISEELVSRGFVHLSPAVWERKVGSIVQGVYVFNHRNRTAGDYYIRIENSKAKPPEAQDFSERVIDFIESKREDLERIFFQSLRAEVLPFFDKCSSPQQIVDLYYSETMGENFLGSDIVWKNYNLGWLLREVGNLDRAKDFFQKVIDVLSAEPILSDVDKLVLNEAIQALEKD